MSEQASERASMSTYAQFIIQQFYCSANVCLMRWVFAFICGCSERVSLLPACPYVETTYPTFSNIYAKSFEQLFSLLCSKCSFFGCWWFRGIDNVCIYSYQNHSASFVEIFKNSTKLIELFSNINLSGDTIRWQSNILRCQKNMDDISKWHRRFHGI